jgi:hypothetical protein
MKYYSFYSKVHFVRKSFFFEKLFMEIKFFFFGIEVLIFKISKNMVWAFTVIPVPRNVFRLTLPPTYAIGYYFELIMKKKYHIKI